MATAKRKRAVNPNIALGQLTGALQEAAVSADVSSAEPVKEQIAEPELNTQSTYNTKYTPNNDTTSNIIDTSYTSNIQTVPVQEPQGRPVGRPRTTVRNGHSKNNGLQPGLERFSVIAESAQVETLRDIAWQTRRTLKEVVSEAFAALIANTPDADKRPRPQK